MKPLAFIFLFLSLNVFGQDVTVDSCFTDIHQAKNKMVHGLKQGPWVEYEHLIPAKGEVTDTGAAYYILTIYKDDKPVGTQRMYDMNTGQLIHRYPKRNKTITKVEMHLSAFGVESDDAPNIDAVIDFAKDSGKCHRSYYDPKYKPSTYYLDTTQIRHILKLLQQTDLDKLKDNNDISMSDQPSSTTIIYTNLGQYKVYDYGLRAESPLQEMYKIVYKLE